MSHVHLLARVDQRHRCGTGWVRVADFLRVGERLAFHVAVDNDLCADVWVDVGVDCNGKDVHTGVWSREDAVGHVVTVPCVDLLESSIKYIVLAILSSEFNVSETSANKYVATQFRF